MDFLTALSFIVGTRKTAADIPVLIVKDIDAATYLSSYINTEGGTGHLTGPFKYSTFTEDGEDIIAEVFEVSFAVV